jgi:hypothetical protein
LKRERFAFPLAAVDFTVEAASRSGWERGAARGVS